MERDENKLLTLEANNPLLIREILRLVRRHSYKRRLQPSDMQDIQQNVLLNIIKMDKAKKEEIKNPSAFLYVIVGNEVNRYITKLLSKKEIQLEEVSIEEQLPSQVSEASNNSEFLLSQIWVELNTQERQILQFLIFDYNQNQIAMLLGISHVAARQRVHRLRDKLRTLLK